MNPFDHLAKEKDEAEAELQELISTVNSEALLSSMIAQLMFLPQDSSFGDRYGNHPAMLEILATYCIPHSGKNSEAALPASLTQHCYRLLEKILNAKMFEGFGEFDASQPETSLALQMKMHSQVVRGSAFPEQTAHKIRVIQGNFDNWFESKLGLSPSRAVEIVYALISKAECVATDHTPLCRKLANEYKARYNTLQAKKHRTEQEQMFVDYLSSAGEKGAFILGYVTYQNDVMSSVLPLDILELDLIPKVSDTEAKTFKELFCVNKLNIGDIEHIQRTPFYEFSSGKVLFSEVSNSFDVIWDTFESSARQDNKFYDSRYQKKKAKWLEQRAYEHLSKFFPKESVYRSLTYPDPTKDSGTTELDLAVKWGPFLIVLEAKAKQFRFESVTGHGGKLRTDIKNNVEDAYQQALRAIQYIDENDTCTFIEADSGRELSFDSDSIHRVFPISLTFHHLAGVATQLNELEKMGLFKGNHYPFSICESDLELLAKVDVSPEVFLHYISKRIGILNGDKRWQGDELDLFGTYLDSRLLLPNIIDGSEQIPDYFSFGGYSGQFDQLMAFERGEYPDRPEIGLNLPEDVGDIFEQLKTWDDSGARWTSFALLELDDNSLYQIRQGMRDLKNNIVPHNGFRRITIQHEDTCISIVGSSSATFEDLKKNMKMRGMVEKYRRKLPRSIVFGVLSNGNSKVFDSAEYIEFDWFEDSEIQKLVDAEPAAIPSVLPKVNEACFCGSGKKYKKCCRNKVDEARKKHSYFH